MAGNAREWTFNESDRVGHRFILGGGWNDEVYSFNDAYTQDAFDRSATNGFRCIQPLEGSAISASLTRRIKLPFRDYTEETPVAVVYRVGWPDEQIIRGTLADIAPKVKESGITLQALVLVGDAFAEDILDPEDVKAVASSHLYSSDYTHLYRRSKELRESEARPRQVANGNSED